MEETHQLFLKIFLALTAVAMGVLAMSVHWADTELWAISATQTLFQNQENHSLSYKFFFHLFMYPIYWFDLSNIQTIQAARLLFYFVGMGILFTVYNIGQTLFSDTKKSLLAVFLVATSTFFISRGFRVRSDLLACLFQLIYLLSFMKFRKESKMQWCIVALFSLIFMLLSTPKAILFLLVVLVYVVLDFIKNKKLDQIAQFSTISTLPVLLIMVILMILKIDVVLSVHDFFLSAFRADAARPDYFSYKRFAFVMRFLKENPVLVFLGLLFVTSSLISWKIKDKTSIGFRLKSMFLFAVLMVILHNDRLPFFINAMSVLPIMILGWWAYDILNLVKSKKTFIILSNFLVLGLSFQVGYYSMRNLKLNSNQPQKEVILYLEKYLEQYPGVTFFDGIGSLPRNMTIFQFVTPTLSENFNRIKILLDETKPDLIFFSNRMFYYFKELQQALQQRGYIYLNDGIFGRTDSLENLKGQPVYKYQGDFFKMVNVVEGEFDTSLPINVYSRFKKTKINSSGKKFFEIFDFDADF